jgi:hypothetical protein
MLLSLKLINFLKVVTKGTIKIPMLHRRPQIFFPATAFFFKQQKHILYVVGNTGAVFWLFTVRHKSSAHKSSATVPLLPLLTVSAGVYQATVLMH